MHVVASNAQDSGRILDHTKQVVPSNPSSVVRGLKHIVKKGKTPVLPRANAKTLIAPIPTGNIVDLRDRALIATMLYSFARIGAVTGMRVRDYYSVGKRSWLRLLEKGGKHHELPSRHLVQEYLDYIWCEDRRPAGASVSVGGMPI